MAFGSPGRVLRPQPDRGSRSTWSHRCSGSPTGRVSPCSSPPPLATACEADRAEESGDARREPRAAALVLASAEASIEIDPERFGLRLRDAAGRLLAEQPGFGLALRARRPRGARAARARLGPARLRTRARAAGRDGCRRGRAAASLAHAARARRRVRRRRRPTEVTHFADALAPRAGRVDLWPDRAPRGLGLLLRRPPDRRDHPARGRHARPPRGDDRDAGAAHGRPLRAVLPELRRLRSLRRDHRARKLRRRRQRPGCAALPLRGGRCPRAAGASLQPLRRRAGRGARRVHAAHGPALRAARVGAPALALARRARGGRAGRARRRRGQCPGGRGPAHVRALRHPGRRLSDRSALEPGRVRLRELPVGRAAAPESRRDARSRSRAAAGSWRSGAPPSPSARISRRRGRSGYLAPGSDLVLDLTNPEARDWWKREHVAFARRWNVAAIKLDRGEEQIPSDASRHLVRRPQRARAAQRLPGAPARALPGDPARGARRRLPGDRPRRLRRRPATRGRVGRRHPGPALHRPRARHRPGPAQRDPGPAARGLPGLAVLGLGHRRLLRVHSREVFARWLEFSAFCPIMEIGGDGAHAPWADAARAALRRGADRDLSQDGAAPSRSDPLRASRTRASPPSAGCRSRGRWCSPGRTTRRCATSGTSICTATICWSRRSGARALASARSTFRRAAGRTSGMRRATSRGPSR